MSRPVIAEQDWREIRFRYLADVRKGTIPPSGIESRADSELLPYLTMAYLRGDSSDPKFVRANPSLLVAPVNSILLLWDGANAGEFLRAKHGVVSSTSALVVPKGVDHNFFYWACKNNESRLRAETTGMGVPHVNGDFLANMIIRLPSPQRQRTIADYLDRETARLDALVAAKERFLHLLTEKRQALIDGVITGRVTPRRLGDPGDGSGIKGNNESERLPEHRWQTKRLCFLVSDGRSDDRKKILADAQSVTFLPMNKIGDRGEIDCSISRNIDEIRGGYTQFFDGDILVAKITPCFENGKGALVRGMLSGVGYGTTEIHVLTPGVEVDGRFLYYVTVSKTFRDLGEAAMYGAAGQKRVPEDFIRNFRAPIPRLAQQRAIADYLDRETARLDELAAKTRHTIALLRERRSALIAAAVTGQIDVEHIS